MNLRKSGAILCVAVISKDVGSGRFQNDATKAQRRKIFDCRGLTYFVSSRLRGTVKI